MSRVDRGRWHNGVQAVRKKAERVGGGGGASLEARHRLRLTSLLSDGLMRLPPLLFFLLFLPFVSFFFSSVQLKLHYHRDLLLGTSPYYSAGICLPFCSALHSVVRFAARPRRDEICFGALNVLSRRWAPWIAFQTLSRRNRGMCVLSSTAESSMYTCLLFSI